MNCRKGWRYNYFCFTGYLLLEKIKKERVETLDKKQNKNFLLDFLPHSVVFFSTFLLLENSIFFFGQEEEEAL
jgi:hypothetical protein